MKLRKLKLKDADLMLEWMHDPFVVKDLQADFATKTITDCEAFINMAQNQVHNVHFAIVDEADTYMGTVSLKHITNECAEFAIAIRKSAMGKGFSKFGMAEIIRFGFENLDLKYIYWCVSAENVRAVRFYDKNGYKRVNASELPIVGYDSAQIKSYIWYKKAASI